MKKGVVIDANILAGYFQEAVIESGHNLTGSPTGIFSALGDALTGYLDESNIIEYEYEQCVEKEWLKEWLSEQLQADKFQTIKPAQCRELCKLLHNNGLTHTRDFIYIKVAVNIESQNENYIITEDLDFFDPSRKNCSSKERRRILTKGSGPIKKILKKRAGVIVSCVRNFG